MSEPFLDLADREELTEARKAKVDQATSNAKNDLLTVLATENGRRFVYDLLADAGVFRSSFVPGDPHGTAFNEGQRNYGVRLLSRLIADAPDQYMKLLKENARANA